MFYVLSFPWLFLEVQLLKQTDSPAANRQQTRFHYLPVFTTRFIKYHSGLLLLQVIATAVLTWLCDKTGRRILLIVSSSGMTVSLILVAASFFIKSEATSQGFVEDGSNMYTVMGILSVIGVVGMIIGFSLGMGPIPWIIMSEILPVNIKGLAGSIATLANWFICWVVTLTAPLLLSWSSGGTFTLYMLMCALTLVFSALLVPETKSKTLEEIQLSFR